jgi:hypothetical protein
LKIKKLNQNDIPVLFYFKITSAEHWKHKRFFKLLNVINKPATIYCDICNGKMSNEIKRPKERLS